jgi:hypothetical protein
MNHFYLHEVHEMEVVSAHIHVTFLKSSTNFRKVWYLVCEQLQLSGEFSASYRLNITSTCLVQTELQRFF